MQESGQVAAVHDKVLNLKHPKALPAASLNDNDSKDRIFVVAKPKARTMDLISMLCHFYGQAG